MPSASTHKPKRPRDVARALAPKEQDFHAVAMEYLDLALPSHAIATTFPAGGGGKIRGAQLKRMGLKAGWPDIQILVRNAAFDTQRPCSRFIGFEAKREIGGRVDVDQTLMHHMIKNAGGVVYVVKTLAEIYHHLTVDEGLRLRCKPEA